MTRWGRLVCVPALLVPLLASTLISASADEYGIKAAFLLNFAKLVE